MSDRRTFIKTLSAGALGAAGLACDARGATNGAAATLDRIGVQLYTVRRAMGEDFEGTIARVAEIGYDEVEFAGYYNRSPSAVREVLDNAGLRAPSTHVSYGSMGDDWPTVIEAAQVIGHDYLIVPGLPRDLSRSLDGYRRIAETFNRAGEQATAAGVRFGFHNHAGEFEPIDGQVPYDILLAETDPELVVMQLDLFWIRAGGQDALDYLGRYPGRFHSVHVKDMDAEDSMVDVGQGVMDFASIFAQRERAGIRHFFVEHDQPDDQFGSIAASYEYLRDLRF